MISTLVFMYLRRLIRRFAVASSRLSCSISSSALRNATATKLEKPDVILMLAENVGYGVVVASFMHPTAVAEVSLQLTEERDRES